MSGNNQPNRPNIDLNEAFEKVNRVGNQIASAFCDLATPIINEIATSINTSHNMNNTSTFGNNSTNNSTSTTSTSTTSFTTNTSDSSFTPQYKHKETNNKILYLVFIPGVAKTDISLKIKDSQLELKCKTAIIDDINWTNFEERFYQIKFKVPNNTKNQDLFVEYHHGVLKIVVTKNNIQDSNENIAIN